MTTQDTDIALEEKRARARSDRHPVDVQRMIAQHRQLKTLCDRLEGCADGLPDRLAVAEAMVLVPTFIEALGQQELLDISVLRGDLTSENALSVQSLLERIRYRHAINELHAEDLHDALKLAARTVGPIGADTLSYMMRCLFDGSRAVIDLEEAAMRAVDPSQSAIAQATGAVVIALDRTSVVARCKSSAVEHGDGSTARVCHR